MKTPHHSPLVLLGILCLLLCALLPATVVAAGRDGEEVRVTAVEERCGACGEFDRLNTLVRDGRIGRDQARGELVRLLPAIRDYYYAHGGRDYGEGDWVFPLKGYSYRAIEGGQRHGYLPRGYDWFAGNRHGGHPAYDIFIRDRNQDDRDDRSGAQVVVLSLTGGIVVARETAWQPGSPLRGGKYLWVYDPASEALVYYAHNRELAVDVGDIVRPGDVIATVGRTGLNAYQRRSPTHLHFSLLRVRGGRPQPADIYPQLVRARVIAE
ncbi:MAG TPA: M23 family metallopeptidase [Geobacteraceae bacterium]